MEYIKSKQSNFKKPSETSTNSFFSEKSLKNVKDIILRVKCDSAFDSLAISKREFYQRAKISPQYWWRLSYGYDDFPMWLKKHLFREFGDAFAFLFSYDLCNILPEPTHRSGSSLVKFKEVKK